MLEQAPRVNSPPPHTQSLRYANTRSFPASQGQRYALITAELIIRPLRRTQSGFKREEKIIAGPTSPHK